MQIQKYEYALVDFAKAIQLDCNYAMAYHNRGICYYKIKNHELALADFTKIIELNPNYAEAYFYRGNCYFDIKDYENSLADFNKAIQLKHDYNEAYHNRANCYHEIKNYELALSDYTKAIQLKPESIFYYNRGVCYSDMEKYELALDDYTQAIQLDPNMVSAYRSRANCYHKIKNLELALSDYTKAIQLNQNDYKAYCNRGVYFFDKKDYELAIIDFSNAIQLNPNADKEYFNRGNCYSSLANYELALSDFTKSIELNPDYPNSYINRGILFFYSEKIPSLSIKDFNKSLAFADFIKAIELNPNLALAYNYRGMIYYEQKNDELALNDFDNAIKFYDTPKEKRDCCFLASNVAITAKQYDRAKAYIKLAFDNDPKAQEHETVYLESIESAKQLYETNEQLKIEITEKEAAYQKLQEAQQRIEEKNKELNNLIAMFAHNFLGTLQCIRSNAEHENNPKIHLKTVKMMSGALTAFSIISADDDKLIEQLKQDNTGETNLLQNLANNLALAVSQLLSKTNKDKIINLYLNYLRKINQIEINTTSEELRENREYRKKWQALQHQWEDEFNASFSENVELSSLQNWLADNFFPVQITGFNDYNIRFKEYGITDSIFLVVFMEILVNALKYMDVSQNQPLILTLEKQDQHYHLICENPSSQETYRGTHKGMDFLKSIARKLNAQFITEPTEQQFKTTFIIPAELLD